MQDVAEGINFLEETVRCLELHGKTEEDVLWVGREYVFASDRLNRKPYKTSWEDFRSKADFRYDNGYGLAYIPLDLILVGEDFWLEREEYDGLEHWAYRTMPAEPTVTRELDLSDTMETVEWAIKNRRELSETEWEDFWKGMEN